MTAFVLKIIALTCMLIDHVGAVFPMYAPMAFRVIGRVSFPIYVYLIADGCRYTRSMPKYLCRLGIFALISQIPFDLAFNQGYEDTLHISFLNDTNVFYTLFLGAVCVYAYQRLRAFNATYAPLLTLLPLAVLMWLAEWLQTDYGGYGVAFIFCMYAVPKKVPRLCLMALFCAYNFYQVLLGTLVLALDKALIWVVGTGLSLDGLGVQHAQRVQHYMLYVSTTGWMMLAACWAAVPLVALYNGRRGPRMKWIFYAAYPVHLLLLGCLWLFWVRPALLR